MRKWTIIFVLSVTLVTDLAVADKYRAIFWNLESGESDDDLLASQMVAKGDVDFWGLSEVRSQSAVNTFEAALEAAHPGVDYIVKLSEDGDSDRLAILYRGDRLASVAYSGTAAIDDLGDNFFEVDSINVGGTVRPALGVQLETPDGQQVIALVNHWKCCGGSSNRARREQQAIQMNAFAILSPSEVPIISGGDFNIPINNGGQTNAAFIELAQVWEYLAPPQNVGTHKGGTILDGVFVANDLPHWQSSTMILKRSGNTEAIARTFSDSNDETDHRPVLLTLESEVEDRLEGLRDSIAEMEAALERMKAELARLEARNQ